MTVTELDESAKKVAPTGRGTGFDTADNALIGEQLRIERMARGISLEQLAAVIGITWQQCLKYELGQNRVSVPRFLQLAGAIGFSPTEFIDELIENAKSPSGSASREATALLCVPNAITALRLFNAMDTKKRNVVISLMRELVDEKAQA